MEANIYSQLAEVLCYPTGEVRNKGQALEAELEKINIKLADIIRPYNSYLAKETIESLEEAYTNTFDIQAVCPLEIGYTLFGEDYKRGEFLVRMSDLHNEHETNLISTELGDYLPNVLRLISKMPDDSFKKDFVEKLLLPALSKMLKNFDESKQANPFSLPLKVASELLSTKYFINTKILEANYE